MKPSVIFLALFFLLGIQNLWAASPADVLAYSVTIDFDDGAGSGTAIRFSESSGHPLTYILTCDHVVKGEKNITVQREGKPDLAAKIVMESAKLDLALLAVPGPLPLAPVLDGDFQEGEAELMAGSPFELGVMLTQGFVGPKQDDGGYLGTATAWPGVSGGGVYVDRGGWRLAGVAQAIMKIPVSSHDQSVHAFQSIGQISFFIPISVVREFLKDFHG